MMRITLDTNILPADDLLEATSGKEFEFASVSVTEREVRDTPFEVHLNALDTVVESGVVGESAIGRAKIARDNSPLREILQIISSDAFPAPGSELTPGQRRQLRDAMILEAHIRDGRDVLVSNDERAFIRSGRRHLLEERFGTKISTREEFEASLV